MDSYNSLYQHNLSVIKGSRRSQTPEEELYQHNLERVKELRQSAAEEQGGRETGLPQADFAAPAPAAPAAPVLAAPQALPGSPDWLTRNGGDEMAAFDAYLADAAAKDAAAMAPVQRDGKALDKALEADWLASYSELYAGLPTEVRQGLEEYARIDGTAGGASRDSLWQQNEAAVRQAQLEDGLRRELESRDINWQEMMRYAQMQAGRKQAAEEAEAAARYADEHGAKASAASVGISLTAPLQAIEMAGQRLGRAITGSDAPVNPYSDVQRVGSTGEALRGQVSQNIRGDGTSAGKNVLGFVYDTAMSGADSLASMVYGPAAPMVLASNAGASTVRSAMADGAGSDEALMLGVAAAVAEGVFERISLGNLKRFKEVEVKTLRDAGKNILKSMGVNASEEAMTEMANMVAEQLVRQDESELQRARQAAYDAAIAQGETPEQAEQTARKAMAAMAGERVGLAAAGGALMGVGFGGLGNARGAYNAYRNSRRPAQTAPETAQAEAAELAAEEAKAPPAAELAAETEQGEALPGSPEWLEQQARQEETQAAVQAAEEAEQKAQEPAVAESLPGTPEWTALQGEAGMTEEQAAAEAEEVAESLLGSPEWLAQQEDEALTREALREAALMAQRETEAISEAIPAEVEQQTEDGSWADTYRAPEEFDPTDGRVEVSQQTQAEIKDLGARYGRRVRFASLPTGQNGYYDNATGEIVISSRLRPGKAAMEIAKHELTHSAEQSEAYRQLREHIAGGGKVVQGWLSKVSERAGQEFGDIDAYAGYLRAEYARRGVELDSEGAMQEAVANFVGDELFASEEAIRELAAGNRSLAQRILDFIRQTIDRVTGREQDELRKLERLYQQALRESEGQVRQQAQLSVRAGEPAVIRDDQGRTVAVQDVDGNVQFNLETGEECMRQLQKWLRKMVRYGDISEADSREILAFMEQINDFAEGLATDETLMEFAQWQAVKPKIDANGEMYLSVISKNGEYDMHMEFSRDCTKRQAMNGVLNRLYERDLLNVAEMDNEDFLAIREIIEAHNLNVTCKGCFVDNKRFLTVSWAKAVAGDWNRLVRAAVGKNATDFVFGPEGSPAVETIDEKALREEVAKMNAERAAKKEKAKKAYDNEAEALIKNPALRHTIALKDLVAPEARDRVTQYAPELDSLIKAHNAQGTPYPVIPDAVYRGDLWGAEAMQWDRLKAFADGGVRMHGRSDFKVKNFLDYCQLFADMAARRLPMHDYTKVPAYIRIFGMVGAKHNMSIFDEARCTPEERAHIDGLSEEARKKDPTYQRLIRSAGLDGEGNYAHSKESFDWDEAMRYQADPRYSKYCGTVSVGLSDRHVRKLLADGNIKMVIPFHASGVSPLEAGRTNVDLNTDYTTEQNTTRAREGYGKKAAESWPEYYARIAGREKDGVYNRGKASYGTKVDAKTVDYNFYDALIETEDAAAAALEYVKYCQANGLIPKFPQFVYGEDGSYNRNYYKLLTDFTLYDSEGNLCLQEAVSWREGSLPEDYRRIVKEELDAEQGYKNRMDGEIDAVVDEVAKALAKNRIARREKAKKQYSIDTEGPADTAPSLTVGEDGEMEIDTGVPEIIELPDPVPRKQRLDYPRQQPLTLADVQNKHKEIKTGRQLQQERQQAKVAETMELVSAGPWKMPPAGERDDAHRQALKLAVDPVYTSRLSRETIKKYSSTYGTDTLEREVTQLFNELAAGKLGWQKAMDRATEIMKKVVQASERKVGRLMDEDARYKELSDLTGKTITLRPEEYRQIVGAYGKPEGGRILGLRVKEGDSSAQGLDGWMDEELRRRWPEFFGGDLQAAEDIFGALADARRAVREVSVVNDYADTADEAAYTAAVDLMEAYLGAPAMDEAKKAMDKVMPPYAKRQVAKMAELTETYRKEMMAEKRHARAVEKRLERERDKAEKAMEKLKEDTARYGAEVAERAEKRIAQIREERERAIKHKDESVAKTKLRNSIHKTGAWFTSVVTHPNKNKNVPPELMQVAAKVAELVNLMQVNEETSASQYQQMLRAVLTKIRAVQNSKDYAARAQWQDSEVQEMLLQMQDLLDKPGEGKVFTRLNVEELTLLDDTLKGIKHNITEAHRLINMEINETIEEVAEQAIQEVRLSQGIGHERLTDSSKGRKRFAARRAKWELQLMTINAKTFFDTISGWEHGAMDTLRAELNKGQKRMFRLQQEAAAYFEGVTGEAHKKEMAKFSGRQAELVDIGLKDTEGKTVKITHAQLCSLWMHLQNEQNIEHIYHGGLSIPDQQEYARGKMDEAYAKSKRVLLGDPELALELRARIEKAMDDYDRDWVKTARPFLDEWCRDRINETSMQLLGYTKAGIKNYFPIRSDPNFTKSNWETVSKNAAVENMGMLKDRVARATNPILLEDINQVIARQSDNVSRYSGMAIPLRNFNRVWDAHGMGYEDSLSNAVSHKWGAKAIQYVDELLGSLNQNQQKASTIVSRWLGCVRRNYAQAVLTINPSSAISQISGYPTAASVLGWDAINKGWGDFASMVLPGGRKRLLEQVQAEIAAHSPLGWVRQKGATQELYDMQHHPTWFTRLAKNWEATEKLISWLDRMDENTVAGIWQAAKYAAQGKGLEVGSKAYWDTTTELFERAIEETQPNYTPMQQAAVARNVNEIHSFLTMFKSPSMANYNVLADAIGEYRHAKAKKGAAEQKRAGEQLALAASAQIAQALMWAAISVVAKGILQGKWDDNRDETGEVTIIDTMGNITYNAMGSLADAMSPIGGEMIYEAVTKGLGLTDKKYWGGIDNQALDLVGDMVTNVHDLLDNGATAKELERTLVDLSTIFGVPAIQMRNWWQGAQAMVRDVMTGDPLQGSHETTTSNAAAAAGKAMEGKRRYELTNAQTVVDRWYRDWVAKNPDKELSEAMSSLKAAMRKAHREEYLTANEATRAKMDEVLTGLTLTGEQVIDQAYLDDWVYDAAEETLQPEVAAQMDEALAQQETYGELDGTQRAKAEAYAEDYIGLLVKIGSGRKDWSDGAKWQQELWRRAGRDEAKAQQLLAEAAVAKAVFAGITGEGSKERKIQALMELGYSRSRAEKLYSWYG